MANDSTTPGTTAAEQSAAPIEDGYFTDMQGDADAFFGPEQLAQAGDTPVVVPAPEDHGVIRVQVTPGEIIELSSPFDPGAALLGREADGNLAIKVGDVTVILMGFVEANAAAPVVVQTSDGQPIDIAILLASTDPSIDIQTAAGPGDSGQGGQGADNTGAILAQLQGGNGLGGLNAVGAQDQTQLSYSNIDNSIRLDREDALLAAGVGRFQGVSEPFLRDPAHINNFLNFQEFKDLYTQYVDDHAATKGGWADFTGTQATTDGSAAFFLDTSYVVTIPHGSATPEQLDLLTGSAFFKGDVPTSNGETLQAEYLGSDHSTIVLVRPSDGAVIMVFHVQESESTGAFHVEVYLVNRLDHHESGQDVLSIGFNTEIFTPATEGSEGSQGTPSSTHPGPSGNIDILDDIPLAHDVAYASYLGQDSKSDQSGHDSKDTTANGKGYVDEDWVDSGNEDYDNAPSGANSDAAHGDDIGRAVAMGNLKIDFGADGPSGADGDVSTFVIDSDNPPSLNLDVSFKAGFVDKDNHVLDANGHVLTSHGHELVILDHTTDSQGIEHLLVGYKQDYEPSQSSDLVFAAESEGSDVPVFELTLDVNPDDTGGSGMRFQDFKFELYKALDQDPNTATVESNTNLQFKVVGQDDDGDHVGSAINIQVNDDSPVFQITYYNEDPNGGQDDGPLTDARTLSIGGVGHYTTTDFGHVDEDWLNGGTRNDGIELANGPGNRDQDGNGVDNANLYGDDKGGLEVCGQINVKYGADGPADAETNGHLALKTYTTSDHANLPLFVNGDGSTLTSDGKPLVVFIGTDGHLQVGVVGFTVPAHDNQPLAVIPDQIVFDLTLDPNTGKFDFQLYGAIDHVPSTVGNNPESNLVLSFNVGSAEDFDHDKAVGAINIKVNDDKPEVGITYWNELPGTVIAGDDGLATKTDTDFGRVDEDWLQGPRGEAIIAAANQGNQDRDAYNNSNANQFGDDYGSIHLSGQITLKFGADGPGDKSIGLATIAAATDANSKALFTSDGTPLVVLHSDSGEIRMGYTDQDGQHTVFLLTLDTNTGHFDFTQFEAIKHPIASPIEDNVYLTFKAGSIVDGDGDRTDAVIKIQVNDDTPETPVSYTNVPPAREVEPDTDTLITYGAPVQFFGQVDEDFLEHGNKDQDNNPAGDPFDLLRGDEAGYTVVTGEIGEGTRYGADGPDGKATSAFALSGFAAGAAFTDADGNPLKSHGNLLVVLSSSGDTLEVGYHNGTDPDTKVFTLEMTGDTTFRFELGAPLDDPQGTGDPIEQGLVLAFGADNGTTDKDHDPAARIVIHVNDDAPQLHGVQYTSYYDGSGDISVTVNDTDGTAHASLDEDWVFTYPIANGSFEDPDVAGTFITLPAGSGDLNGWTVGGAGVDHIGSYWQASDGSQSLDVSALDKGSISRELTGLKVGQEYTVKFDLAGNPDGGAKTVNLRVDVDGAAQSYAFNTAGHTTTDMGWSHQSFTFIATSETQTLTFASQSAGGYGPALDNVSIVATGFAFGNQDQDNAVPGSASDPARGDTIGSHVATGKVLVDFGADVPADNGFALVTASKVGDTFVDEAGAVFLSHGNLLEVLEAAGDHISVGYGDTTVFEIHIDQNTGAFTFDLKAPLDHPKPDNFSLPEDRDLPVSFKVTATDFDGDSVNTTLNFHVNDDAPGKTTIEYSAAEALPNPDSEDHEYQIWGTVDEDWVAGGNHDKDGDAYSTDGPGTASVTAQVIVPGFAPGFGADGPADHPFSLFVLNAGDGFDNPLNGGSVFSQFDGTPLVVISSSESELVVGHKTGGDADDRTVFKLTLDQDTGLATFTLVQGLESKPFGDNLENGTKIGFTIKATDYDGDISYSTIRFRVNDDRPSAHDDDAAVPAGALLIGNVLTGDKDGNGQDTGSGDGLKVTHVNGFELNQFGQLSLDTAYGKLLMNDDGLYNFTANKSNGADSITYGFGYQVVDGDGDVSSAVLYINIPAFAPSEGNVEYSEGERIPDPDDPTRYEDWGTVDEDWVPGGNKDDNATGGEGNYPGDGPGKDSVTATIKGVDFGVDGPAEHPYALFVQTKGDEFHETLHGGTISSQFDPDALVIVKSTESELVVGHKDSNTPVFTLTLDQDTGVATLTMLQGIQSFPYGDNEESGATLAFGVRAIDANGDESSTRIQFRVNDDRPVAVSDDGYIPAYIPGDTSDPVGLGNLFVNDTGKGDGLHVSNFAGVDMPAGGQIAFDAKGAGGHVYGRIIVEADGLWNFRSNQTNATEIILIYDYSIVDGDGDKTSSSVWFHLPAPATHVPGSYDYDLTVTSDITATLNDKNYHLHDATGGHEINGAGGNDYIEVTGGTQASDAMLNGNGGNDIVKGGNGKDVIHGDGGDDTLYGGNNDDDLYGDAGHDAMHGGLGNDTFHNIDADDLDGTNTLDGTHSIIGGGAFDNDTAQLGGLANFGNDEAEALLGVGTLDFKANSAGDNSGTTVSLNYDAVYGITQVGGLHALTITGDKAGDPGADHVLLENDGSHAWTSQGVNGGFNVYTAGIGLDQVTVKIQEDVAVTA